MKVIALRPRPVPRTFSSWLLHSSLFVSFWLRSPRDPFSRFGFLVSGLCMSCQSFVMIVFGRPRSLSKASTYSQKSTAQLLFCLTTFILGRIKVALHLFNEAPAFIFFIFPFSKFCKPVLFVRGRTFDHCVEFSFSLRTLPATFVPRVFFPYTTALTASNSAESTFHLPFGFTCSHASWELWHPLLPAGCCHLVFVVPYQSLLLHFHLSLSWPSFGPPMSFQH